MSSVHLYRSTLSRRVNPIVQSPLVKPSHQVYSNYAQLIRRSRLLIHLVLCTTVLLQDSSPKDVLLLIQASTSRQRVQNCCSSSTRASLPFSFISSPSLNLSPARRLSALLSQSARCTPLLPSNWPVHLLQSFFSSARLLVPHAKKIRHPS